MINCNNIYVNTQSSIKIILDKIIYFDPFKINNKINDADIIFITHDHYDHFDINSINNIINDNTIIICPKCMEENIKIINSNNIYLLDIYEDIKIGNMFIKTIPAYNINKNFHPKSKKYLGYLITYNNITYYISGDTDLNEDNSKIKCDIVLIPIGGYYTMDVEAAYEFINIVKPSIVIPTHYGSIVGDKLDGKKLKDKLSDTNIKVIEKLKF